MTNIQRQLFWDISGRGRREQEKAYYFPDLYGNRKVLSRLVRGRYIEFENRLRRAIRK